MVLGKLPVPGRPTILITVGQGPTALAVGAGGGGLDIFTLIYPFSPLSPSLWETARYRLKYCVKGPLNPKKKKKKKPKPYLFKPGSGIPPTMRLCIGYRPYPRCSSGVREVFRYARAGLSTG